MEATEAQLRAQADFRPARGADPGGDLEGLGTALPAQRPISAIAYACGFGDLSGFSRAFKDA